MCTVISVHARRTIWLFQGTRRKQFVIQQRSMTDRPPASFAHQFTAAHLRIYQPKSVDISPLQQAVAIDWILLIFAPVCIHPFIATQWMFTIFTDQEIAQERYPGLQLLVASSTNTHARIDAKLLHGGALAVVGYRSFLLLCESSYGVGICLGIEGLRR